MEAPARPLRIGLIHLMQETDTFNPVPTTLDDFRQVALLEGEAMLERVDPNGPIAGYRAAVEGSGVAVHTLPVLRADAQSGGRLSRETLDALCDRIRVGLTASLPVDGLVVLLHGAAAADGVDDVEGHVLGMVREVVGPAVPLALMLDHHANVTAAMMRHSDVVMAFRTQPHDPYATAHDLTSIALGCFAGDVRPTMAWRKVPMITHQEQYLTAQGPMKEWFDRARAIEREGLALTVSQFPMQPWLDVEEAGWAVVVVTDGDGAAAEALADELADMAWGLRHRFMEQENLGTDDAIAFADDPARGAVLLSDTGDSVLGGSPGDSTVILRALLATPLRHRALVPLTDPVAAQRLSELGDGDAVDLEIGGWSTSFSSPVRVTGTRRAARSGPVTLTGLPQGTVDMGAAVVLDLGQVTVLVTEHPGVGGIHPGVYRALGVEPADYKMIVMKTASNFQYMRDITTTFVRVASPGPTQSDVLSLPWSRIPRPMFPLDALETWR